jgi:Brp/Blh family beta-carotene 15,15'-monooxygenase
MARITTTACARAPESDTMTTGVAAAPVAMFSATVMVQAAITAVFLLALASGADFASSPITGAGCLLILILGMPHGAFDIRALLAVGATRREHVGALVRYCAAGAMMALLWSASAVLALAVFLVIAVAHFGEDWSDAASPFLRQGAALGLLSAPALLHGPMIRSLFETVSGQGASALLGDVLTLIAPVAVASTLTATALLWSGQKRDLAMGGLIALIGLITLPPIAGFALFFCLQHSPRHYRKALGSDGGAVLRQWAVPVTITTMLALAMTAMLYWLVALPSLSAGLVRASFIALSILTVPHMLLPRIVRECDTKRSVLQTG